MGSVVTGCVNKQARQAGEMAAEVQKQQIRDTLL